MKNILILTVAIFILSGCQSDNDIADGFPSNNIILKGAMMVDTNNKVFNKTEGNIYFNNQNSDAGKSYAINATFFNDLKRQEKVNVGAVKVNDINMSYGGDMVDYDMVSPTPPENVVPSLFGTDVTFFSEQRECTQTFYVPNEIALVYPVKPPADVRRFDRGDGMKLKWNADPLNPEGVFIYVRWDGKTYNAGQEMALVEPGANVESGAYVSDSGTYILDEGILAGMDLPDNALLYVQILRGHVGVVKGAKSLNCKAYAYTSFDFYAVGSNQ